MFISLLGDYNILFTPFNCFIHSMHMIMFHSYIAHDIEAAVFSFNLSFVILLFENLNLKRHY